MADVNVEPRLALWCRSNPDLAAARIETLESVLEVLCAQYRVSDGGIERAWRIAEASR